MARRANITDGIWTRNVHWSSQKGWRTGVQVAVLDDPSVKMARYILDDGPTVTVAMADLRVALKDAPRRTARPVAGPYNIDPVQQTINDIKVPMTVSEDPLNLVM